MMNWMRLAERHARRWHFPILSIARKSKVMDLIGVKLKLHWKIR